MHKKRFVAEEHAYAEKLSRDYGYDAITLLDRDEVSAALGTDVYYGGSRDAEAGHLHPLNFALGLARAADRLGVKIYERTRALAIHEGEPMRVDTDDGCIRAEAVVVAGNGYLAGLDNETETRIMPINNFVLATAPLGTDRARALIPATRRPPTAASSSTTGGSAPTGGCCSAAAKTTLQISRKTFPPSCENTC